MTPKATDPPDPAARRARLALPGRTANTEQLRRIGVGRDGPPLRCCRTGRRPWSARLTAFHSSDCGLRRDLLDDEAAISRPAHLADPPQHFSTGGCAPLEPRTV